MKKSIQLSLKIFFFIATMGALLVSIAIGPAAAVKSQPVQGYNFQGNQSPQDGMVEYQFSNNLRFQLQSQANITVDLEFENSLQNRFFGLRVNNSQPATLKFNGIKEYSVKPGNKMGYYGGSDGTGQGNSPHTVFTDQSQLTSQLTLTSSDETEEQAVGFSYDSYYELTFTGTVDAISIFTEISQDLGISEEQVSWAIFDSTTQKWYLLDSEIADSVLSASFADLTSLSNSFGLTVVFIENPSTPFYKTPLGIGLIIGIVAIVAVFGLTMSKAEYRSYLLNRFMPLEAGPHRMSMEQVLENENRTLIINTIIDNPGVHFNELLRIIDISAGTLAWHLDILETFKVVWKQRVGQYLTYYPYLDKNPISKIDPKLQKSKTTLEILQLINDNPGIYQNQIAKRMDLNHKTIKYHIDKLLEAGVIEPKPSGRKQGFFPKSQPIEKLE